MFPKYRFLLNATGGEVVPIDAPYDAEVAYLEGRGQACIDTGYVPNADTVIECEFSVNLIDTPAPLFGNYVNLSKACTFCRLDADLNSFRVVGYASPLYDTIQGSGGNTHTLKLTRSTAEIDGNVYPLQMATGTANNTNLAVFKDSVTTALARDCRFQLFRFKISESGVLIRDFIPVRVGSVGYLFDRVNEVLYGNVGTSQFYYGSDTATKSVLAKPIWNNGLSVEWNKESGFEFFRRTLNGELTFIGSDLDTINNAAFDTEFKLDIDITYNGTTWAPYWGGKFFKTDCKFAEGRVSVTPQANDDYSAVLSGLDKEFDIVQLAPEIGQVKYKKRPVLQLYVPGETVITNFVGGLWWEQECKSVVSGSTLRTTYKFGTAFSKQVYKLTGEVNAQVLTLDDPVYDINQDEESGPLGDYWVTEVIRRIDGARWYKEETPGAPQPSFPITLDPDTGTPATAAVTIDTQNIEVYGRYITDASSMGGFITQIIPTDDICDHGSYTRVLGIGLTTSIYLYTGLTSTPTQWGLFENGQYYIRPYVLGAGELVPIGRSVWGNLSLWFSYQILGNTYDEDGSVDVTLRDAYPIWSVIDVLLGQISSVRFENTAAYSQILCGYNPIGGNNHRLYITPKTNVLKGNYDQPARSAKTTLRKILDMLWATRRCVWWIENGKLRIEHIVYLMNGGAYSGTPVVGVDLTTKSVPLTGKSWATGQDSYSYNKPDMPQRYEFGWGDKVSHIFEGDPVQMVSKYVGENVEKIVVEGFNSDVDYMLANPGACSQDGFAILDTRVVGANTRVAFGGSGYGSAYKIQNYELSFQSSWLYYLYDLPCPDFVRGGSAGTATKQKRYKVSDVKFPAYNDVDTIKLIKTNVGDGQIEKLSINLSSRTATATLNYDTD